MRYHNCVIPLLTISRFRWVYCQLEVLRKCYQRRAIRKALSELPVDLDDTYTRIFQDIESNHALASAITILQWLCYSDRPLRLTELVDVLAIMGTDSEQASFDPDERLPDPYDIKEICSSMIICHTNRQEELVVDTHNKDGNIYRLPYDEMIDEPHSGDSDIVWVQLAHFTVREYLLSDRCPHQHNFQSQACHLMIGKSCLSYLQYLSQNDALTTENITEYPTAEYAGRRWWQHLQNVGDMLDETTINLVYQFLTTDRFLLLWSRLFDIDRPWRGFDFTQASEDLAPPLYYASSIGIPEVVQMLVRRGADVNAIGGYHGCPLQAAVTRDHDEVVQILLRGKADVHVQAGPYGTALHAASAYEAESIVTLLLDAGADVNMQNETHSKALQLAAVFGNAKMVQLLLDAGADANACGGLPGTSLRSALERGYVQIVRLLLNAGADFGDQDDGNGSTLSIAAGNGHSHVVKLLLDAGAGTSAHDAEYGQALLAAIDNQQDTVVQLLFSSVDYPDSFGSTALHRLCYHRSLTDIALLIERGANPTLVDGYGRTCLDWIADDRELLTESERMGHTYIPTPANVKMHHLQQSVQQLVDTAMGRSKDNSSNVYHKLGLVLMFLSETKDALIAFRLQIQQDSEDRNLWHPVICDLCDLPSTDYTRHVCMRCANVDLCIRCLERYKQGEYMALCREHEFLDVPLLPWDDDYVLNKDSPTEKMRVWLQNLSEKVQLRLEEESSATSELPLR